MLRTLTCQLLLFPTLVVLLASASFFCGMTCSAWQWYVAIAATLAAPFVMREGRSAARLSGAAFLATLAIMWLMRFLIIDHWASDILTCHLPMTRLLAEGWNPVLDPMGDAICDRLGIDQWDMSYLHVVFSPKMSAVFNAVACSFVGDPFAISYSIIVLMALAFLLKAIDVFRYLHWGAGLVICAVTVFGLDYALYLPVDATMAFASGGLALSMYDSLRCRKVDVSGLVLFGTWTLNTKFSGVVPVAVMSLFIIGSVLRGRLAGGSRWNSGTAKRITCCMAVLVGVTLILNFSPLFTSWSRFGHPLYPTFTVDKQRCPVMNLAWDFDPANDDARQMGQLGNFVNAYVSPWLARKYYSVKLRKKDFSPRRYIWDKRDWMRAAPMRWDARLAVFLSLCVLLCVRRYRVMGVAEFVLLLAFPGKMMGYMRYQPWVYLFEALAVVAALDAVMGLLTDRWRRKCWIALGCCAIAWTGCALLPDGIEAVRVKREEIRNGIPDRVYIKTYKAPRKPLPVELRCPGYFEPPKYSVNRRNNIKLLLRQLGIADAVRVVGDCLPRDAKGYRLTRFGYAVKENCND